MGNADIILETDDLDMDLIHYLEEKYTLELWKKGNKIYIQLLNG